MSHILAFAVILFRCRNPVGLKAKLCFRPDAIVMSDRLAAFVSWFVFSVLVLAALLAVLFLGEMAFAGKAAGFGLGSGL